MPWIGCCSHYCHCVSWRTRNMQIRGDLPSRRTSELPKLPVTSWWYGIMKNPSRFSLWVFSKAAGQCLGQESCVWGSSQSYNINITNASLFIFGTILITSCYPLTAEQLQDKARQFSIQDIVTFLQSKKLDQYATAFEEYEINGELLIQFQDEDLEDLGVNNPLHRLIIRMCFRRLVLGSEEFASQYPPQAVAQFLDANKQLKQFSRSFLENAIDGELLLNASDDVLQKLGVEKGVHMRMIRTKFKSWIE